MILEKLTKKIFNPTKYVKGKDMNLNDKLKDVERRFDKLFLKTREKEGCQAFSNDCGKKDKNGKFICEYCRRWNGQQREIQVYEIGGEQCKSFYHTEIKKLLREVMEEVKITNKIKCASFSEEENFVCDKVLPIEEMEATVKNPNTFYCKECYQRGIDMEYEAMGLREEV